MTRALGMAMVGILLAANTWSGVAKVASFWHRYQADWALTAADLDAAYWRLKKALEWVPDDPTSNVQMSTVVQQALANGLPLKDLEGRSTREVFGAGLASIARAIALNPADAWGWFNLASLCQGYRSSHVRLERMRRVGELAGAAAGSGSAPAEPAAPAPGLDPIDRVSVAAALQALEADPAFFFYRDFLAKLYWDRGLRAEAETSAMESMRVTPRLAAHTVLQDDEFVTALAEPLLRGIEQARDNPFVGPVMMERARAELLNRLGRFDEAIASYEELRRQGGAPLAQECDLALGKLAQRKDRWRESLEPLERAHERDPATMLGTSALYYMGLAHEKLGEPARAADLLERYVEAAPEMIAGYHTLARVKESLGDRREARRLYIAAVRRFPRNRLAYLKAIESLRDDGELRQALLYAEALRRLEPGSEQVEALIRDLTARARGAKRPR